MAPNPTIMQAVEALNYRVTIGDVAAKAGFDVQYAERELLTLASEAGGHLQVAESGDIAYLFPQNFRAILRQKFLRLRLQEWWQKVWRVLFYLIRISFGILLIVSIVVIFAAIFIIMTASNRDSNDNRSSRSSSGGGFIFFPRFWYWSDFFWLFSPNYEPYQYRERRRSRNNSSASSQETEMNFLEAVFSFLFGDGNPNGDLEERRRIAIATTIRNNGGAIAAEQIAPYVDKTDEYEDYMLPVLTRFGGLPKVSPDGDIVYYFPELQITAADKTEKNPQPVSSYLRELPWRFSEADSGQLILAAGLGGVNIVGALILGNLLRDGAIAAELGGFVAFVGSIYWLLLGYGIAFLTIPLIRYLWLQGQNGKIEARNQRRQERAQTLASADDSLQKKLAYASQFASQTVISGENIAYTSETDLVEQQVRQLENKQPSSSAQLEGKE